MILVLIGLAFWVAAWRANVLIARRPATPLTRFAVPAIFGITLLVVWELLVRGLDVPGVILPAPTTIAARFADSADILWADFIQTFVKGALSGYAIGCGAAFAVAILVDRSPFLQRGLLPVATSWPLCRLSERRRYSSCGSDSAGNRRRRSWSPWCFSRLW